MGMYTHVNGVLHIGSFQAKNKEKFQKSLEKAAVYIEGDYNDSDQILERCHILEGGNNSLFLAIAVEGKIEGYGNDWDTFLKQLILEIPSLQGEIEYLPEDSEFIRVYQYKKGELTVYEVPTYREGYGNGI